MSSAPGPILDAFRRARTVTFLTGAGMSADSGLPVYRGVGGLYERPTEDGAPIEDVLSGDTFRSDPGLCWKYLRQVEEACRGARANDGHRAIAALERRARVAVLTQNVDGFHRDAGSTDVIEVHGTLRRRRCPRCGPVPVEPLTDALPRCASCGGVVRPDVVLFGEGLPLDAVRRLRQAVEEPSDLVVTVGTSSGFPYIAAPVLAQVGRGGVAIEINPGETSVSDAVTHRWAERAVVALPAVLAAL